MITWFTWTQVGVAVVIGLVAVVFGLVGRKPNDYTVGGLVLIELLLIAQGIVSIVVAATGSPTSGNALEFGVYAVSVLLVPPAAIVWALVDRTRWSTVVLGVGAFTVAVMVVRMQQIWFPAHG
jgi:hypothetical protein